jgi:general secretion pathway protein D
MQRTGLLSSLVIASLLVSACAGPIQRAEDYAAQEEWMKAVVEYRKAAAKYPADIEYRSRLRQTELKAADFYYLRGARAGEAGDIDGAILLYQQGLSAMPDHSKLLQAMNDMLARKEASRFYREGLMLLEAGKTEDAKRQFKKALEIQPNYSEVAKKLTELESQDLAREASGLVLSSKTPVTLSFQQGDLRTAFNFLGKSFGVNVIFDDTFKTVPVTLLAKDVTFDQGLTLLLSTTRNFYKRIGPNTILISPDSKEKRGQYEDLLMRTFPLNTVRAKDMTETLKGLLTIKKISFNETLNTVTVRDTEDILRQVERLTEINDKKPAEIILEVEILEVNRTKAERLGLDLGAYEFTAAVPNPVPVTGSIRDAISSTATLTIPSATFRFFKQDVDAKILANPKVRVISGKNAKIHIGERVPLRVSTIIDATGQTRTTFDYKDIGVRLTVDPTINLDNSCMVKLGLEVSALGENLGTIAEPAYSIISRNAETNMLLRDGETAILGGLIREEERRAGVKVPGLGDIPAVGELFTAHDNSDRRTDVLLTITPRVVRSWDVPTRVAREFYSGTENSYAGRPLFASLEAGATSQAGKPLTPRIDTRAQGSETDAGVAPVAVPSASVTPENTAEPPPLLLTFAETAYEVDAGKEIEVRLIGQNLSGATVLPMEILYNPQLLTFVRGVAGEPAPQAFSAKAEQAKGIVQISLTFDQGSAPTTGNTVLANLMLRGEKSGVSYLIFRQPAIKSANGENVNVQVRASRVVVR